MPRRIPIPAVLVAFAAAVAVAGCGGGSDSTGTSEPFEPHATLKAVGGTVRADKPTFVMHVDARPGDANILSVAVNLPPVVLVDPTAIGVLCSESELESDKCKGRKPLGSARVLSPAYPGALTGPVYAVSGSGRLPRLAYVLSGPADVLLRGKVVSKGQRLQTGVEDVPDTPLKSFELTVDGGKPGYLVLNRNICSGDPEADATFVSQDDQTFEQKIPLEADCSS